MRIQSKLLATTLAVAILPVVALGFFAYSSTEAMVTDQANDHVDSMAALQEARVSDVLREKAELYQLIAARRDLPGEVHNLTQTQSDETREAVIKSLEVAKSPIASVLRIDVAARNGTVVASTAPASMGVDLSGDAAFVAGATGTHMEVLVLDPILGVEVAVLSGPLVFEGQPVGVLLVYKEPTGLRSVASDYTGLRETGETLILAKRADGTVVYIHPLRFDPDATLVPIPAGGSSDRLAQRAFDGQEGILTGVTDYRGEEVVASVRTIDSAPLAVVVKIDQQEVNLPLARLGGLLTAVAIAVITVAGLGGILVARSVGRPLRELQETASEISRGNLERRARVHADDEIGQLANDFNRMAGALIDSRHELERKVKARTAALERSNKELESFAYVASHDLQEPLRSVSGFVQLLQRRYKGQLDDQADEYIAFAVEAVKRMQDLIQDLLMYSRVESRGKPLTPTDLNEVFDGVVNSLQVQIEGAGAHVTRDDLPEVIGDDVQLGQLLQNLIQNAIKFRKKDAKPTVHVGAAWVDGAWQVTVRDDGIGIAPEYAEKVFIIFQRLHRRDEYEGTGIGLAVCKKIVNRHGGRIWVESKEGEGAAFHFTLRPTTPPEEPGKKPAEAMARERPSLAERGEELV